ncbi:MAG: hypothetical protein KBS66_03515 [Eubacterium sp.]|nr:hypothetical protein [Candidatus Colimonas fimequi]
MDATTIINSITRALDCAFDEDAAVKRLQGFINQAGNTTLHIKKHHSTYSFYSYDGIDSEYMSKKSPEVYRLTRKKYCEALIALLEASEDERTDALENVATLLRKFEIGHLDLLRIVYSKKQYQWYTSNYARKKQPETGHLLDDYLVRSKSEQDIGLDLLELGIPFHFEERLEIYVFPLVEKLQEKLRSNASERVFVMKATRAVEPDNLIETFEYDTDDKQRLAHIINTRILPGVWW